MKLRHSGSLFHCRMIDLLTSLAKCHVAGNRVIGEEYVLRYIADLCLPAPNRLVVFERLTVNQDSSFNRAQEA
jgi:hypothetical protein